MRKEEFNKPATHNKVGHLTKYRSVPKGANLCYLNLSGMDFGDVDFTGIIWKAIIHWGKAAGIHVKHNTDGKFYCEECVLLGKILDAIS